MSEQSGGNENNLTTATGHAFYHTYRRGPRYNYQSNRNGNDVNLESMETHERPSSTSGSSRQFNDHHYSNRQYHSRQHHDRQFYDRFHHNRSHHNRPNHSRQHHERLDYGRQYQNRSYHHRQGPNRQCDDIQYHEPLQQPSATNVDDHVSYSNGQLQSHNSSTCDNQLEQNFKKNNQCKNNQSISEYQRPITTNFIDQGNQAASLRHQIESNTYECMVCYETINAFCATYSCFQCFNIFHLMCIRQWASSKLCDSSLPDDAIADWTCPACQVTSTALPIRYTCFCSSVINPAYKPFVLPHSCGEKCIRFKESCNHSCPELCHPGKCPPCLASVVSYCLCGMESKRIKCSMSDSSFNCKNICQKRLNCRKHNCEVICHGGPCENCPKTNDLVCYCGKSFKSIECGLEKESHFLEHSGYWSCSEMCSTPLSCGNHACNKICHPGPCPPCEADVSLVTNCPCGKSKLEKISQVSRESCLDAIPTCKKICRKVLSCGKSLEKHLCQSLCHNGSCPPCLDKAVVTCNCKSSTELMPCIKISGKSLTCERVCYKKKSCGRHRCNTKCCLKDNHICMIPCGKLLSCKSHKCEELCHRGHCMPCLMSNFDEVFCNCGKTKLDPPVACGTPPPTCHEFCSREHFCSHPVTHKCHYDDQCPPCAHLVNKVCMGGHKVRYNVPCHMNDVSCGEICQKQLPCNQHKCDRWCHKGDCVPEDNMCELLCLEPRPTCLHPCNNICHSESPCPSSICFSPIKVVCGCKRREIDLLCFKGSPKISEKSELSNFYVKLKSVGMIVSQTDLLDYLRDGSIQCVEKCKVENRNQRLAESLGLKDVPIDNVVAPSYPESLKKALKENKDFIFEIENTFMDLISKYKKRNQSLDPLNKVKFVYHDFKAMNQEKRKIIHDLASFYKVETQSFDSQPQRNVQVKIAYNSSEPTVKLSQFFHKRVVGGVGSCSSNSSQKQAINSKDIPNLQTLDIHTFPRDEIVFDSWEDIHE